MSQEKELQKLRKQVASLEKELAAEKKSAERMKLALDGVEDGLWDYDMQEQKVFFSPRYYTMLGYQPYELPQSRQTWIDLLHPDDREKTVEYVDQCIATQQSWSVEFRLRTRDGGYRWILGRGRVAVHGPNGEVLRRVGTHTDITQRKQFESKLNESKERYKSIFNMMPSAMWEEDLSALKKDLDALRRKGVADIGEYLRDNPDLVYELIGRVRVIDVNPTGVELFEAEHKEQLINGFGGIFNDDTLSSFTELLSRLMNECYSVSMPFKVQSLKGNSIVVRLSLVVLPGCEKDWSRVFVAQMDITEIIQANQQAELANQAKSAFLANMSHDLRTPINGIMGMLQLLQNEEIEEQPKEYVNMGISSCLKLSGLLNDILDLSRIEAGKLSLSSHEFRLDSMFKALDEIFRLTAKEKGLELIYFLDDAVPNILVGDERRLLQILMNLVGNALKFTKSGAIRISIDLTNFQESEIKLLICVSDSGIGIDTEKLCLLFEPFTQEANSAAREGSGLGLAIVRKLVLLMGGEVCVASDIDRGTSFYINLPFSFKKETIDPVQPKQVSTWDATFKPFKVLVVEDDSVSGLFITTLLKKLGAQVDLAATGQEGLLRFQKESFDIAILDIQLPDMTGLELVGTLRTSPDLTHHKTTPVVALTANAMTGDREKCLAAGMTDYIAKPVDHKELVATLCKYIEQDFST